MKTYIFAALILAAFLLLAGCGSGGEFQLFNETSYPLYVSVDNGDEVTIAGGANHIFHVSTATEHIFNPDVEKEVPVRIVGETYSLYDEEEEAFTDSTTVTIAAGETLKAYINPNRASFKVVNNSSQAVDNVLLYKHNFVAGTIIANLGSIEAGSNKFLRVDYATANNNFYYYAVVQMEDGTTYTYGNETNVLLKDQQFLVTLVDPDQPSL